MMARKLDEAANFVLVQLIEKESGIYDKGHLDYARRDKVDLAWEKISHEMKESGIIYIYIYIYKLNSVAFSPQANYIYLL
jgi:hypothetical protein